ncbi:hypothetical protein P9139_08920 [Curtobacterium flaccumfaciens]|nr:hypothetical protein P9139_08920 [Curtobacterium flaccumfaciens]
MFTGVVMLRVRCSDAGTRISFQPTIVYDLSSTCTAHLAAVPGSSEICVCTTVRCAETTSYPTSSVSRPWLVCPARPRSPRR